MSLLKNSIWNIAGLVIPSLIAIPAMGIMAHTLTVEKFGLFTLAYIIIGYASIFDAGLSRAVIRAISTHRNDQKKIGLIVGTSIQMVFILGLIAASTLWALSPNLSKLLSVSNNTRSDLINGLHWLTICIPAFLLTQIWQAYLEGTERFAELNIQKSLTSSLIALFPTLAILIENSLTAAIIGLVTGRLITAVTSYLICQHYTREIKKYFDKETFKELISFGAWITISNITSPIMVYFDRFIISHLVGAGRVAFYNAPSEIVARISIIPGAVARALFPKLSDKKNKKNHATLHKNSLIALLIICSTIAAPLFVFSEQILELWMGKSYRGEPATILRILLIGFIFNGLAQIPFSRIQANGNSKATAIVHLTEILPYLSILYILINKFALTGAAIAWTGRMVLDCIIFSILSKIYNKRH